MKKQISSILVILLFFIATYHTTVLANSSWNWLTSSPKGFLPYAILLTLGIEIMGILFFAKLKGNFIVLKVVTIIVMANLASFLLPYTYRAMELQRFYSENWATSWDLAFVNGPYYIVLAGYLFLTLGIEGPLVYLYLKKYVRNTKTLLKIIIILNVITTIIVALIERMMFLGKW